MDRFPSLLSWKMFATDCHKHQFSTSKRFGLLQIIMKTASLFVHLCFRYELNELPQKIRVHYTSMLFAFLSDLPIPTMAIGTGWHLDMSGGSFILISLGLLYSDLYLERMGKKVYFTSNTVRTFNKEGR